MKAEKNKHKLLGKGEKRFASNIARRKTNF